MRPQSIHFDFPLLAVPSAGLLEVLQVPLLLSAATALRSTAAARGMDSPAMAWAHAIWSGHMEGKRRFLFGIAAKNTTATIAKIAAVSRTFFFGSAEKKFGPFFLKTKVAALF